ncbi:M35 family metallo-endopeptidase [Variovorax sp. Varisp62]|uniref:M35 family metallo-endopeptidase n=1 Tax=Variovorax sp. Varisp62 TaxID=3243049 RepID=UPI0039B60D14
MERKILVVGDPPVPGGRVLPYDGPLLDLHGHRVALIGGRAYCEGCNSVGIIAKAGGPRRPEFISEAALEGDVVVCHCALPQPLLATLQHTSTYDDGMHHATAKAMASFISPARETAALKKAVDEHVSHPPEAEQMEKICSNMTNKEFAVLVIKLRDMAIDYILKKRLPELQRWDKEAQARTVEWFGTADQSIREYLQEGLVACARVLRGLEPKNFIRYAEGGKIATCVLASANGAAAAACKPDTATRTIAIASVFCNFRFDNKTNFDTGAVMDGDSRLLTLVHEVTHFDDTFSSNDTWYGTTQSREHAEHPRSRSNADSLASYILGVTG